MGCDELISSCATTHAGEALGLPTCRSACGAPAHPLLGMGSLSRFDGNHTPGRKPPLTKTWVSLPSEGRAAHSSAPTKATFSFCLNCQEIFGPVPPSVKHLSNLCVTLLLPHPALVCRLSYQAHQAKGLGGNFSGPRNISVWWFGSLNTLCMWWDVSLKRVKWLSKFWLLINFSVCVAEGGKGGGKPGLGSC